MYRRIAMTTEREVCMTSRLFTRWTQGCMCLPVHRYLLSNNYKSVNVHVVPCRT